MREHWGWEGQLVRDRSHASSMVSGPKHFVQFQPSLVFSDVYTRGHSKDFMFPVMSVLRTVPTGRSYCLHLLNEESEAREVK